MKKLISIITLTMILNAGYIWKDLKPIKEYTASGYKMKSDIVYLEIRQYRSYTTFKPKYKKGDFNSQKYKVLLKIGKKPKMSAKRDRNFKYSKADFSKTANIRKSSMCFMRFCDSQISNAFIIDNNGKAWRLNEVQDIINILKPIDTPAELKLLIWLKNIRLDMKDENHKEKYKKTKSGYQVIQDYDNSTSNYGECGHFNYKFTVYRNGAISKKRLLYKTKSKYGCFVAD